MTDSKLSVHFPLLQITLVEAITPTRCVCKALQRYRNHPHIYACSSRHLITLIRFWSFFYSILLGSPICSARPLDLNQTLSEKTKLVSLYQTLPAELWLPDWSLSSFRPLSSSCCNKRNLFIFMWRFHPLLTTTSSKILKLKTFMLTIYSQQVTQQQGRLPDSRYTR